MRSVRTWLVWIVAALSLAGCGALPGRGPSTMEVTLDKATSYDPVAALDFAVVPLDAKSVAALGAAGGSGLGSGFSGGGRGAARLGPGDTIAISVWEAAPDGLFSTIEQKQSNFTLTVGENGSIFMPFVGEVPATGRTADDLRSAIAAGLEGKAVDPQVTVGVVANTGQIASVIGDVRAPGRFDIPSSGLRLVEAVAMAGGATHPDFETEVTLVRGGKRGSVWLDDAVNSSASNVWLMPRDTVQISHKPRSYTAFGAVTSQNRLPIVGEKMTLAEALAETGGLNDNLADTGGVFVFRFETGARLRKAGVALPGGSGDAVPTVYRLDFSEPQAFFLAARFAMRDKDMIYVANAPAAEFRKFVTTILSPVVGTAQRGKALAK